MPNEDNRPKRGRPSKKELASTDNMSRRQTAAAIKEYKQRLLLHPDSPRVINSIVEAALNDEHKHQAIAWKLMLDRIAPVASFSAENRATPSVEITIKGIGEDDIRDITPDGDDSGDDVLDVEFSDVE